MVSYVVKNAFRTDEKLRRKAFYTFSVVVVYFFSATESINGSLTLPLKICTAIDKEKQKGGGADIFLDCFLRCQSKTMSVPPLLPMTRKSESATISMPKAFKKFS